MSTVCDLLILEDNTLRVSFDLEFPDRLSHFLTPDKVNSLRGKCGPAETRFSQDFEGLFNTKQFSDVTIRCAGKTFSCHKAILSARSKVFKAMLNSDMQEVASGQIPIDDLESTVVEAILRYIYTGRTDDLPGNCRWTDLIHGAEKYDFAELKNIFFVNLLQTLNEKNAGQVALVVYKYNADAEIKLAVKEYCHCHIQTLLEDSEFREIFFQNMKAFYD